MRISFYLICFLLITNSGCVQSTINNSFVFTVKPIIVTNDNTTLWHDNNLERQILNAVSIWSEANIVLRFLEPEYLEDKDLYVLNINGFFKGINISQNRISNNNEYVIFFNRSNYYFIDNASAFTVLPSLLPFDTFCIVSSDASETALAHEMGHVFGLTHSWEGWFDGIDCDKYDCQSIECKKNVMGYCFQGIQSNLTDEQIRIARFNIKLYWNDILEEKTYVY